VQKHGCSYDPRTQATVVNKRKAADDNTLVAEKKRRKVLETQNARLLMEQQQWQQQQQTARDLEQKLESLKECGICNRSYTLSDERCPRQLQCGHTLTCCHTCMNEMLSNGDLCKTLRGVSHLPCPFCRKVTKVKQAEELNKDFTVLALLD